MEFSEVVRRRHMVRRYDPERPVPADVLEAALQNACRAPSAGFSQGWDFVVLTSAEDRERFWTASTEEEEEESTWLRGMQSAPALVVCCSDREAYLERYAEADKGWTDKDEARWPVPYWHIDAGFASLLVLHGAVDAELGACFFGIPPERFDAYRAAFDVPVEFTPIGAISIGYPAPDRRSPSLKRGRRPVAEVAHRGRWGRPY